MGLRLAEGGQAVLTATEPDHLPGARVEVEVRSGIIAASGEARGESAPLAA